MDGNYCRKYMKTVIIIQAKPNCLQCFIHVKKNYLYLDPFMGHILIMIGCFCKACKSGRLQPTPAAFILACEKSKDCKNPCFFAALNDNNYRKYLQTWIIRNPRQNKLSSMCCVLRKIAFYLFYLWGPHFDHDLLLLRLLHIRLFEAPGAFILDCS